MASPNLYDVTGWPFGNPHDDIGQVINSILADIKARQRSSDANGAGKPGAAIYIPPGDYRMKTQVVIDISFLKIFGSGHGFTSSSIRFNTPAEELAQCHEVWPGGSRIMVDLPPTAGGEAGAAFLVKRGGNPRISAVEFADFCIDGLHFLGKGAAVDDPENSYRNAKTGILVASPNDSFRITGMGIVYLEHGITVHDADAMALDNNFIAECGTCIALRGRGQACRIGNNLIGAGYNGHSILAENHGGLLVSGNNVFPRGSSSVHFTGVARSSVSGNRFHSFYPGMLVFEGGSSENLVTANHFLRDREPWAPMTGYDNGRDDQFGLLHIQGSNNSVIANHISLAEDARLVPPPAARPVIIQISAGEGNHIANNHVVATTEDTERAASDAPNSACFATQVGALLSTQNRRALEVTTVRVAAGSSRNTILDSGSAAQVEMDRSANAFRPTPVPGA
jgi:inulin fructotransferase (DFA-I-forming)